LEKTDNYCTEL